MLITGKNPLGGIIHFDIPLMFISIPLSKRSCCPKRNLIPKKRQNQTKSIRAYCRMRVAESSRSHVIILRFMTTMHLPKFVTAFLDHFLLKVHITLSRKRGTIFRYIHALTHPIRSAQCRPRSSIWTKHLPHTWTKPKFHVRL